MRTVIVVTRPDDWPIALPGVEIATAADYLTDAAWTKERGVRVFNLCRSFRYQSQGYYVSLLAAARRHRPFPDLMTVLDMKSRARLRVVDDDLETLVGRSLEDLRSERFELSVYFGKNLARRHERLARRIFNHFPAPLLRAVFAKNDRWRLQSVAPIGLRDVPGSHHAFLGEAARAYFDRPRHGARRTRAPSYSLAILHAPEETLAPSDPRALSRFRTAATKTGFGVEMIQRDDYGRLGEFDALFIRETTAVNHHTFRFAQRAETEGLAVIDDPESILRCTNKVFQAEAFEMARVPTPKTLITDRARAEEIEDRIGFPCVLKYPDSSFSQGVVKCSSPAELAEQAARIGNESELFLVQEFLPSDYDWRIGVFGGQALYACRYLMARGHWQVVKKTGPGRYRYGRVEPVALDDVPPRVVKTALRAAATIGEGLYGVDLKEAGRRVVVTEVNDNPNVDHGCEDAILGAALYERIMGGLLDMVERRKAGGRG